MGARSPYASLGLAAATFLLVAAGMVCGCHRESTPSKDTTPMNAQSIEKVLETHTPELMAIPGVVGVYQGELEDGRACITVMVIESTPALESKIPKSLGGYPVVIEAGGEIKPLGEPDSL